MASYSVVHRASLIISRQKKKKNPNILTLYCLLDLLAKFHQYGYKDEGFYNGVIPSQKVLKRLPIAIAVNRKV